MDCNSIVYDAVREIEMKTVNSNESQKKVTREEKNIESQIIGSVCKKILWYMRLLNPRERVYIAFDGVAPVAKLEQQRNRRYKTGYQKRIMCEVEKDNHNSNTWNTAAITPGTSFMSKLGKAVRNNFSDPGKFNLDVIIVSSADDVGEGEHKIYEYIRKHPLHHKSTTTVIYGLDADLIMLTLNHLHISPSLFLFRETPHFIKSIDSSLSPNDSYLLDIPIFGRVLSKTLNNNKEPDTIQKRNRIFDYIFLCFFLGNDFLPHFPALNIRTTGIDRLLSAYNKVIGTTNSNLVDGTEIVWKHVRKIILELANRENEMIREEYKKRSKQSCGAKKRRMSLEETFLAIPLLDRKEEDYINPFEEGWEVRYYKILFDIDIDDHRRKQICINYLEGLEWTLNYYTNGCIDWRWTYEYNYPPLLSDLSKYIPYYNTKFVANKSSIPVSPLVQLSYVLPGNSLDLLPSHIRKMLLENYPECYSQEFNFCWAFCKYFWESHALMPKISLNKLEVSIEEITNS